MPRKDSSSTIARQWEILKHIPSRGCGITVAELTEKLDEDCGIAVTRRTVERDLESLCRFFPLRCNDVQKPWGWKWMEGASLGIPGLDLCDAVSLLTAREVLSRMLPAALLETLSGKFREAENKLKTTDSRLAKWPDKVRYVPPSLAFQPPKIDAGVLRSVQSALMAELRLEVDYRPVEGDAKLLTLSPLALIHRGPVCYLAATAFDYDDVRLYAVHRIAKASVSDERANRPTGFSIDAYLEQGAMDFCPSEPVQLVAEVSEALAAYLAESKINDSQEIVRGNNGERILKVTTRDSWQLRWWLLSQGDGIVVREPEGLRRGIFQTLSNASKNYTIKE